MDKLSRKELSAWWNSQTVKTRKEVLKSAHFHSGDISSYKLARKSIEELQEAGWGIESISKASKNFEWGKDTLEN